MRIGGEICPKIGGKWAQKLDFTSRVEPQRSQEVWDVNLKRNLPQKSRKMGQNGLR